MAGEGIEAYLNSILAKYCFGNNKPGKVLSTVIIPDFVRQLEIEMELLDLQDFKKIIEVDPPLSSCIVPAKYKNQDAFEDKVEQYENMLQEQTMKPFLNSGHAFICFDSVQSVNIILKHFRTTPMQNVKIFC